MERRFRVFGWHPRQGKRSADLAHPGPGFYRTSRQGQFGYDIPLKKGIYELHLHFAETVFGPESNGTGGEGSRIMTVRANGKVLLQRFDVVADAGASRTADVKVFPDMAPAADGQLHLEFAGENGMEAILWRLKSYPAFEGSRAGPHPGKANALLLQRQPLVEPGQLF